MNKKLLAILIIIFALLVLIGLIYFLFLAPVKETTPAPEAAQPVIIADQQNLPAPVVRNQVVTRARVSEDELKSLSASFVERFGSYSNQSGYQNIRELDVFMSQAMQTWAASYIAQARASQADTSIYYGITTKAVVVGTNSFSDTDGRASFTVQTQRREAIGTSANERSFQQTADIALVKEAGVWKVDSVSWAE
ncbi:hypothetical protein A2477_03500 [Candidatus Falkowbacteria bacterium RIFOXYC2_FULL_47_12]|uniref:Uncharacterized protein n=2 Tax=Candidatus Falkowiibacteriota TaxID=1752728 RepID=A0A1F5TRS6_9BACT|nr:MAG: hypothetical protein A2242_00040 [Candidatus Falkowbacteria bacterium RIFOXYA2_FULL_47_9]OGF41670.1 MAG: hypothetical protein A2477_03500 [Candidatus Falkowbacteria bacterium RIFOXYC2_FULL_47_12]